MLSWMKCKLEMSMQAKFQRLLKSLWVLKLCLKVLQPYTKNWRYTHVRCYPNAPVNWPVAFFPHVKERESRSSLDLSATIFIHVGCSIRYPSIPLEHCLKRCTYRRGVRIAEKTQIHKLALHLMNHTFHAIKIIRRKCLLFVEFKIFVRCWWTSPYEHLCDTGTSLIPYREQVKSMYILLEKKTVLYGSSKSQTFMLSLNLSDIHVIRRVCLFMFL